MSTVTRPREPELDAEQEVELGRYWRRIAARWWLPLVGLAAGAVIGYLLSLGGSDVWKASAVVYLGTPYSTSGNVLLQSPQTNPATVKTIATSEAAIEQAAAAAGMKPGELRGHVSTQTLSSGTTAAARVGQTPQVRLTVEASTRRKAAVAANTLAGAVVGNSAVAGYADAKIANFTKQLAVAKESAEAIKVQLAGSHLSDVERLLLQLQLNGYRNDQTTANQLLSQARAVEKPRLLTRAAAVKTTARSRRNSVVVGAFLGLLLGIAAALAWEPLADRRG